MRFSVAKKKTKERKIFKYLYIYIATRLISLFIMLRTILIIRLLLFHPDFKSKDNNLIVRLEFARLLYLLLKMIININNNTAEVLTSIFNASYSKMVAISV